MIRAALLADADAIFGIASIQASQYEGLRPDAEKIRKGIVQAISSAKHFAWVTTDSQDRPCGVLIGLTSENLWAQRQNCLIALWVSDLPGEGRRLLKAFKSWVQSRRAIRVAGFVPDSNHIDQRAYRLAERMGFERCGGAYLLYN
jgi:hypothetical protein